MEENNENNKISQTDVLNEIKTDILVEQQVIEDNNENSGKEVNDENEPKLIENKKTDDDTKKDTENKDDTANKEKIENNENIETKENNENNENKLKAENIENQENESSNKKLIDNTNTTNIANDENDVITNKHENIEPTENKEIMIIENKEMAECDINEKTHLEKESNTVTTTITEIKLEDLKESSEANETNEKNVENIKDSISEIKDKCVRDNIEKIDINIEPSTNSNIDSIIINTNTQEASTGKPIENNTPATKIDDRQADTNTENNTADNNIINEKYFYENLMKVINMQENILNVTSNSRDKLVVINGVAHEQLKNFKESYSKYGKFFKLIHGELATISDLMK